MRIALAAALAALLLSGAVPTAQPPSDLDQLMERVLAQRDENWKKLQQYVLEERETFDLTGPGGARLYGFRKDYSWFMQDGVFVRSPLRADGVTISESDRRNAEAAWIRRERRREERRAARAREAAADAAAKAPPSSTAEPSVPSVPSAADPSVPPVPSAADPSVPSAADPSVPSAADPSAPSVADTSALSVAEPPAPSVAEQSIEPSAALVSVEPAFVSHAYFLRFRFEPNHYALVGRETIAGKPVLRVEYYPSELFREGRTRPNRRVRDREENIEEKMNKVSLVTLWVDPNAYQILQYAFDDIDMDFLPGRTFARVDDVKASMRMGEPFPGVWLPRDIEVRFRMTLAAGAVSARYLVEYHDYRQADVTYKVR
jgi:hypothetical protein